MTVLKITALTACIFLSLFPAMSFAQISDDFSDGNITDNPAWQGETTEFIVNAAGELQLNAPDAGSSVLAVQGNIPGNAIWLLDLRLEFAPSANNLLRIYLQADQADLLQSNGYFLEIGENGTADALRFYRQDGGAKTLLSTGTAGLVANEPVDIAVRVKRSKTGSWTIDAAPKGGAFELQGAVADVKHPGGPGQYFGFYCLYSATRKDKFFFDNFFLQNGPPDTDPPVLLSARAISPAIVAAAFDETLDSVSALDPANYQLNGVGEPATVKFAPGNQQEVWLTLFNSLPSGTYTLEVSAIADIAGNAGGTQTTDFQFFSSFDIQINEIMANPAHSQGLPDAEWIELYNSSTLPIDLQQFRLSDGGSPQLLPAFVLQPDSFLVLTGSSQAAAALAAFTPNVRAMSGFPALNNDGDDLSLTDAGGNLMDRVIYSIDWHTQQDKKQGGWTLERINPRLPCLGAENWQSCPVKPGGTPGAANASLQQDPDTQSPHLSAAFPESTNSLLLNFSEGMDVANLIDPALYHISPALNVDAVVLSPLDRSEVNLILTEPLEAGIIYALTVASGIQDCSGNPVPSTDTVFFGLPETPAPFDIVINEVLFNPSTNGVDFIELYNRSNKVFSWQNFSVDNADDNSGAEAIGLKRLFFPGDYAVLTPDPSDIENRFANVRPRALLALPIPSLPDDAGNITLFYAKDGFVVTVDSFDYSDDYHNALYSSSDREGVSLERIRPDGATNDPANWTSAARSPFGAAGTPTLPNGQRLAGQTGTGEDLIQIEPARLSPDGDGYEDFLDIRYHLPAPGYSATISIYDSDGIPVKKLVRQDLIGVEGALRWDGDQDDGTRARPGIYILFAEVFTPTGTVSRVKKPLAVVTRY